MVEKLVADGGRISWVLRPMKNDRGEYWMGNSRIGAELDLSRLVFFVRQRDDGTLSLTAEQYDPRPDKKKGKDPLWDAIHSLNEAMTRVVALLNEKEVDEDVIAQVTRLYNNEMTELVGEAKKLGERK